MDRRALFPVVLSAALAACGGSSHHPAKQPTAASVCDAERQAAVRLLGAATQSRIADSDPTNIECVLSGSGVKLDVIAQATPLAWTEYDTATVHLAQAFGSGSVHKSAELPRPVPSVSGNAVWVPAQGELIATNGTQTTGGSYVTVTVKRQAGSAPAALSVAAAGGTRDARCRTAGVESSPPELSMRYRDDTVQEPLALLLLPCDLEQFERQAHARDLLQIPRVIALEPSRRRAPRWLRDTVPVRQAKRLKLPGRPRMIVLYHPSQYPLARALSARHPDAELWYVRPDPASIVAERTFSLAYLHELDQLACDRAALDQPSGGVAGEPLRIRLRELEITSPRPFVPGARIDVR